MTTTLKRPLAEKPNAVARLVRVLHGHMRTILYAIRYMHAIHSCRPARRCAVIPAIMSITVSGLAAMPAWAGSCPPDRSPSGPPLVVTIKPVHSLASALLDGIAQPHLLVKGAASPHGFTFKPSDLGALARARLLVRVSPELELFVARIGAASAGSAKIVSLIDLPGLALYKVRDPDSFGGPTSAPQAMQVTQATQNKQFTRYPVGGQVGGRTDVKAHHRSGDIDPHIWLDPENARRIVAHLDDLLRAIFPDCRQRLKANAAKLTAKLRALHAELAATLKPLAGRPYGVFHDAYQYLERRYGLAPVGAMSLGPDQSPGARRISVFKQKLKTSGARCLFAEPQFQPRLLHTLTEGLQIRSAVLDPLGASLPPGPEMYFTLLRNLATDLTKCLAPH